MNLKLIFVILIIASSFIIAEDSGFDKFKADSVPSSNGISIVGTAVTQSYSSWFKDLTENNRCSDTAGISDLKSFYAGKSQLNNTVDLLGGAVLAAILIVFGVTIMYLGGKLLQADHIVAIAKEEYWQSVLTVIRVGFIITSVIVANTWIGVASASKGSDPVYGGVTTMIDASMNYSNFILAKITDDLGALIVLNTFVHSIFSATVYVGITFKSMFSFQVGPILKPIVDILGVVIQFLSVSMGEWLLHYITLCFIKRWTFTVLIPIAMFMRAFPYTRGGGDALMALLFSFAVIYPAMFVVSYEIYKDTNFTISNQSLIQEFFDNASLGTITLTGLILMLTIGSVIIPFIMGMMLSLVIELIRNAVYYIVITSILLPFITIFLTLTSARESAKFFNLDINFAGFVSLI